MNFLDRIEGFIILGKIVRDWENSRYDTLISSAIQKQSIENHWFPSDNIRFALKAIGEMLQESQLLHIQEKYARFSDINRDKDETVAVISAGNIPIAGFHDFFSVLVSGCNYMGKLSKNDQILLPVLADILMTEVSDFKNKIIFCHKLGKFDKIVMTGSNNSARYFEYYFGKYPNILRKNRNSVAILNGNETETELENLFNDIFLYFGLGCRSVSKLFVPQDYSFAKMIEIFTRKGTEIAQHHHYLNNLDYQKTLHLMNRIPFIDTGIAILTEKYELNSPISVIHFSRYNNENEIFDFLQNEKENIQCIVSGSDRFSPVRFGEAQCPKIDDFADNIDVIQWIINS